MRIRGCSVTIFVITTTVSLVALFAYVAMMHFEVSDLREQVRRNESLALALARKSDAVLAVMRLQEHRITMLEAPTWTDSNGLARRACE